MTIKSETCKFDLFNGYCQFEGVDCINLRIIKTVKCNICKIAALSDPFQKSIEKSDSASLEIRTKAYHFHEGI